MTGPPHEPRPRSPRTPRGSAGGSHASLSAGAMLFGTLAFLPILGLIAALGGAKRQAYAVVLVTGSVLFGSVGVILALKALVNRSPGLGFAAAGVVLNVAAITAAVWLFASTVITR